MIQVTMLDTVELATYSVRTFALYKVRASFLFAHLHMSSRDLTETFNSRAIAAHYYKRHSFRMSFPMFAKDR